MKWSDVLLSLLLIAVGMVVLLSLNFSGRDVILAIVAIAAGVLRLVGR